MASNSELHWGMNLSRVMQNSIFAPVPTAGCLTLRVENNFSNAESGYFALVLLLLRVLGSADPGPAPAAAVLLLLAAGGHFGSFGLEPRACDLFDLAV